MRYEGEAGFERLMSKARLDVAQKNNKSAVRYAGLAAEVARQLGNLSAEVSATFLEATTLGYLGEHEKALAKFSWVLSIVDNHSAEIDLTDRQTAIQVVRAFCYWVRSAARALSVEPENALKVFAAGEKYIASFGQSELKAEFFHAKSLALEVCKDYRAGLIAAEEGLALKRLNPYMPGCELSHHLIVYGRILGLVGRHDDAITAITEAVDKFPSDSKAWRGRGYQNYRISNYAAVISDYTEALFLERDDESFRYRGLAYLATGSYDQAISDYNEAIALKADAHTNQILLAHSYQIRGLLHELQGRRLAAVRDLRKAIKIDQKYIYPTVWLAGIAQDCSALKKFAESEEWMANVVRFYLDEIDEEQLIKIARDAPAEKERNERLCETHAFIGLRYDSKGVNRRTIYHYRQAVKSGVKTYYEFLWSTARLKQLKS